MKKLGLILAAYSLWLLLLTLSWAATPVLFTWDMPTVNEDNTPITDLAGVKLRCGGASGVYTVTVDAGLVTTYTDDGTLVPSGTKRYCVANAYDTSGNMSVDSNEVMIPDFLAPGAIINFEWSN